MPLPPCAWGIVVAPTPLRQVTDLDEPGIRERGHDGVQLGIVVGHLVERTDAHQTQASVSPGIAQAADRAFFHPSGSLRFAVAQQGRRRFQVSAGDAHDDHTVYADGGDTNDQHEGSATRDPRLALGRHPADGLVLRAPVVLRERHLAAWRARCFVTEGSGSALRLGDPHRQR